MADDTSESQRDAAFAEALVKDVGDALLKQSSKVDLQARLKDDGSLVTRADWNADDSIREALTKAYPGDALLSEESSPRYTSERPGVWVIDPLDGTTNFSLGLPFWGVSIARVVDGGLVAAGLYFPVLEQLYRAAKGQGTFLNGDRLRLPAAEETGAQGILACCSRTLRTHTIDLPFKPRVFGSVAYSLCSIATGVSRLALTCRARVWDVAAATLVVQEAGGIVEPFAAAPPFPLVAGSDYATECFATLAAPSAAAAAGARRNIQPL